MEPQASTLSKTLRAVMWFIIGLIVAGALITGIELNSYHALFYIPGWVSGTLSLVSLGMIAICILGIAILAMALVVILFIKIYSLLRNNAATQ